MASITFDPKGDFKEIPYELGIKSLSYCSKVADIVNFLISSGSIWRLYSPHISIQKAVIERYSHIPYTSLARLGKDSEDKWWERDITAIYLNAACDPTAIKSELIFFKALTSLKISPDCLGKIFSFPKMNEAWKFTASPLNIAAIDLDFCAKMDDAGLLFLAIAYPKLKKISLNGCEGITNHGLGDLAKRCTSLETIHLAGCSLITDEGIETLLEHCSLLKRTEIYQSLNIDVKGDHA